MENGYLTLREIQTCCMNMLRVVDKICREEKIQYFLSGGTLLGAVRHNGFIPWDDDVDLMMPRPEYERFIAAAPKYLRKQPRYELACTGRSENYATPWVRLFDRYTVVDSSGMQKIYNDSLFIDIFPIDGLPAAGWASNLHFKVMRAHDILLKCSRRKDLFSNERLQGLKRVLMRLTELRAPAKWAEGMEKAAKRFKFEKSKYRGVLVVTHYGSRERMPAEVFEGSTYVQFEDAELPAPKGWETYLRGLYGDYMQLPPEDKRYSLHRINARMCPPEREDAP